MNYVHIASVKKQYGEKTVLNNISLSLQKGELVTLLGQSGCGKSTLLQAIAGITSIDNGVIRVNDQDITHLPSRKREIGMVFQSYALFPNMTVAENIGYGFKMKKIRNRKQEVEKIMDIMGLAGLDQRYPHELSGGQQQRVALARALILKPKILLLDEPLSALDAKIRKTLQTEIKRIQSEMEMTTIFVTHDQKEAMVMSDRIYVMNEGVIEQEGTPEEIYTKPKNKFVASFIGSYNVLTKEAFESSFNEQLETPLNDVAIRPESIEIYPEGKGADASSTYYTAKGKVRSKMIGGSVVTYQVQLKSKEIQVDQLFQGNHHFTEGTVVDLLLPKQACIPLKD